MGERIAEVPAASNKSILIVAAVREGVADKGSNKISFEAVSYTHLDVYKRQALGWVAMVSIGTIYYLLPRLFGKSEMYSIKLMTVHFWVATIGVVLYIASMWIAGVMQGLMWRSVNADGTLAYSFVESVKVSYPFWGIRFIGGVLFLAGMLILAYNMFKTCLLYTSRLSASTLVVPPLGRPSL